MDTLECINNKRSVRAYKDEMIPKETLMKLIELGTKASSGSDLEPWGFVIIQDKNEINNLSETSKEYLLNNLEKYPYLKQYKNSLESPDYNIFNNANTLLIIYGDRSSHWYVYDCTLAAGNIMLSAYSMGIGTCWIGFAEPIFNREEFKKGHGVPDNFELVSTLSMGYIKSEMTSPKRKKPLIFTK